MTLANSKDTALESVRRVSAEAGLTGRRSELEELKKDVVVAVADPKVKAHLTDVIDNCLKGQPETPDEAGKILNEFAGGSRQRGGILPTTNRLPLVLTNQHTKPVLVTIDGKKLLLNPNESRSESVPCYVDWPHYCAPPKPRTVHIGIRVLDM